MRQELTVGLLTVFCTVALVVGTVNDAHARSFRPSMLPNGSVNSCSNCHFNRGGGGRRNPFGEAVQALVTPGGRQVFWGPDLAALDSDGDGVSNGEELGDPEGQWVAGDPAPGNPARVTNPGDPEDRPEPEPAPAAQFRRGDFNSDGQVNITDPISTLSFLFAGIGSPSCLKAVDTNGDGSVNIADATFSLNFLFSGGPAPPAPFPECGTEPEDDSSAVECEAETCT